ncbi:hypothetical protein XHV734_2522 [Xanthomonas hortorum pv. vitians]|nr:hypothetical protein XHV734_2522 [Xanthomonas hortorum pv. vitians]
MRGLQRGAHRMKDTAAPGERAVGRLHAIDITTQRMGRYERIRVWPALQILQTLSAVRQGG